MKKIKMVLDDVKWAYHNHPLEVEGYVFGIGLVIVLGCLMFG